MSLFQRLFGKKKQYQVYCQGCNTDITLAGGYISPDGKAYCGKRKEDETRCLSGGVPKCVEPNEFSKAISEGHLIKYSRLEK